MTISNVGVNSWASDDKKWINIRDLINTFTANLDDDDELDYFRTLSHKFFHDTFLSVVSFDESNTEGHRYNHMLVDSICTPCIIFNADEPEEQWTLYCTEG